MIDLKKYESKIIQAPVIDNRFTYNGKSYQIVGLEDGWYQLKVEGNKVVAHGLINIETCLMYKANRIKGYIYNNNFIPFNFDEGKRKIGNATMFPIYLNKADSFSPVIAIIWQDGRLFYFSPNYTDFIVYQIKRIVQDGGDTNETKGVTPELRTVCLFHILEQQRLEVLKKEAEAEELRKTLEGRLVLSFRRVGAELLKYSASGNRIICDWSLSGEEFNSVLERDTFRVIESGYCMSNSDKDHNIHSLALTAKGYMEDNLIYKTRE